jgi:hypothetical protein
MVGQPGLFVIHERLKDLCAKGADLERLNVIVDFELFRPDLEYVALIASRAPLEGRDQRRLDPAHRTPLPPPRQRSTDGEPIVIRRACDHVARHSLGFYEAVGRGLAGQGRTR